MRAPFQDLPPLQQPNLAEVADAFKETVDKTVEVVENELEDLPERIRSWSLPRLFALGVALACILGGLTWVALRPWGGPVKQQAPLQTVSATDFDQLNEAYSKQAKALDQLQARLTGAERDRGRLVLEVKALQVQLENAVKCGRSDEYIDNLNRKAATR